MPFSSLIEQSHSGKIHGLGMSTDISASADCHKSLKGPQGSYFVPGACELEVADLAVSHVFLHEDSGHMVHLSRQSKERFCSDQGTGEKQKYLGAGTGLPYACTQLTGRLSFVLKPHL